MITLIIRFQVIANRLWKDFRGKSLPLARRLHETPTAWFSLRAGIPVKQRGEVLGPEP